ncbi:hypothetical protein [Macrococcus armenti]|uniref:hypothetical protein n=1 Tax=Macrococcus armenti TaxID=2875764 RepID=UPI001CCC52AC|nr:hypothetical protein [Macrococcus armenti]UBH07884.1 hypothetical protein LAU41_07560 [Macrococcus armenti]
MAKYSFKEQLKISASEKEYKKTLNDQELRNFKSLSRSERDDLIWNYINGGDTTVVSAGQNKVEKWLSNKGIHNATQVTVDAVAPIALDSKMSKFTNTVGSLTLDIHKQAEMNSNLILQAQNYALIAQNDEVIKQNDEIIRLLREIAQK